MMQKVYAMMSIVQVGALLDLIYTGVCNDPGDIEPSGELALLSLYK